MLEKIILIITLLLVHTQVGAGAGCGRDGIGFQVLGSGGPELEGRASTGYLVWLHGKARILIDMGSGSLLRFEQSGASLNDLQAILFSHFHVDHSADIAGLIKASYFSGRDRDLPVYGPSGNDRMPGTRDFLHAMFGRDGAFRYLREYLGADGAYRLIPHQVDAEGREQKTVMHDDDFMLTAVPVHHGPIPALAWRIDVDKRSLVISGDMNNDWNTLAKLAAQADLLVAHHAISEGAGSVARNLHMPPSVIGRIAAQGKVGRLVLSHRMQRTLGREQASLEHIRQAYEGPVTFADDLQCFEL